MRLLIVGLALLVPILEAPAGPIRLGDGGFRIGQSLSRAVLSPDGRWFAVGGTTGGFHWLDAVTGAIVRSWPNCPEVMDLTFDPTGRLLVLHRNGWLRVYEPRCGRCVREVLVADPGDRDLRSGHFYPGGHFIAFDNSDPSERSRPELFDTARGEIVAEIEPAQGDDPRTCSDDGRFLVILRRPADQVAPPRFNADCPAELRVVDRRTGRIVVRVRDLHPRPGGVAFRPDGRELLILLADGALLVDLTSGKTRPLHLAGGTGCEDVYPVWSPDGRRVALQRRGTHPGVREWDRTSGQLLREEASPTDCRDALGYTADGRLLQWNTSGVRLNVHEVGRAGSIRPGHVEELFDLRFASDGTLVTLDRSDRIIRWDVTTGRLLNQGELPRHFPHTVCLMADGRSALLIGGLECARIDLTTGQREPPLRTPTRPDEISPDGRWLLDWERGRGRLFDTQRRRTIWLPEDGELWPGGKERGPFFVWSANGRWLALGQQFRSETGDGQPARMEIAIVKLATGRLRSRFTLEGADANTLPQFTPDGSRLLVEFDGRISVHDPATGRLLRRLEHPESGGRLYPLSGSPDGRLVLVAAEKDSGRDGVLWLIELLTGSVRHKLPMPTGYTGVKPGFSPDGRTIALALSDATVALLSIDDNATSPDRAVLWRDLASPNAAIAGAAVRAVASRPDAVRWVRARLVDASPEPDLPALFWLAELEHDDPDRREAARRQLSHRPDVVRQIEAALTGSPSPDLARTLAGLREERVDPLTPEQRRIERLREILDRVGSAEAKELATRF